MYWRTSRGRRRPTILRSSIGSSVFPSRPFRFGGRNCRPPRDRVNALLSFLYTLLIHDCRSAPGIHRPRSCRRVPASGPPRPTWAALDLAEEFRPVIADRLALSLINRRQLAASDFTESESGAVVLKDDARKKVLAAYQERKRETLRHTFTEENAELGLFPWIQAQSCALFAGRH